MGELLFIAAQVTLLGVAWYVLPRWIRNTPGKGHHAIPSPLHLQRLMPGISSPLATGVPLITISEAPSPGPTLSAAPWLGGGNCSRRVSFQAVRPYKDAEEVETTVQRPLTPWMPMPTEEEIEAEIEQEQRERAAARMMAGKQGMSFHDEDDEADMDMFEWDVKLGAGEGTDMQEEMPREASLESARVTMLN